MTFPIKEWNICKNQFVKVVLACGTWINKHWDNEYLLDFTRDMAAMLMSSSDVKDANCQFKEFMQGR